MARRATVSASQRHAAVRAWGMAVTGPGVPGKAILIDIGGVLIPPRPHRPQAVPPLRRSEVLPYDRTNTCDGTN
jgi:hypothetical protein